MAPDDYISIRCFVCSGYSSHGNSFDNNHCQEQHLSSDKFVKYANWIITYKKYIPADFVKELEEIIQPSEENLEEIAGLNEYFDTIKGKKINKFEINDAHRFEKECPKSNERLTRAVLSMIMRILNLSEPAKQFITENGKSSDESNNLAELIRYFAGLKKAFDKLPINVQIEYEVQFPEIMRFLGTPAFQSFINNVVELSDKSDEEITNGSTKAAQKLVTDFMLMDY